MKIDQHVVRRKSGWAVLGEGNHRDTVVLPTQEAAVARAREIARKQGGELIVHPYIQPHPALVAKKTVTSTSSTANR